MEKYQNRFYVLKDNTGELRPMAFICRKNERGEIAKQNYKLEDREEIVECEIIIQ